MAITPCTLTLSIQANSIAMTVPGTEIAPGTPEPIKENPARPPLNLGHAPKPPQAEDKAPYAPVNLQNKWRKSPLLNIASHTRHLKTFAPNSH